MVKQPFELDELEREITRLDNEIEALERKLFEKQNERDRARLRLIIARKRINDSGIKY